MYFTWTFVFLYLRRMHKCISLHIGETPDLSHLSSSLPSHASVPTSESTQTPKQTCIFLFASVLSLQSITSPSDLFKQNWWNWSDNSICFVFITWGLFSTFPNSFLLFHFVSFSINSTLFTKSFIPKLYDTIISKMLDVASLISVIVEEKNWEILGLVHQQQRGRGMQASSLKIHKICEKF